MNVRRTLRLSVAMFGLLAAAACGGPADDADPTLPVAGLSGDTDAPPVPADLPDDGVVLPPAILTGDAAPSLPEGFLSESPPETEDDGAAVATDAGGADAGYSSMAVLATPQCLTASSRSFYGRSIGAQTGPFQITWDVTPLAASVDAAVSVSKGLATSGWANLAAIVRFNVAGRIDARDGATYAAAASMPYVSGRTYRVRATVDPAAHRYTVGVTAPGGAEQILARDYAFRNGQESITQVDNWVAASFSGGIKACLLEVSPVSATSTTPPPTDTTAPPKPAIPTTPIDPTLRTVAQWEALFLNNWESEHANTYLPYSTSRNSWRYYNLAYGIDGLTAMYEATGNRRYLDRALLYVENVVNSAVRSSSLAASQYKDSYLGWGAWDHPTDPNIKGGEYPLYESYCFRYVAKMLRAMRDDPAVYGNATYRAKYDRLLAFTKQNVWNKWMARGPNAHVYRVNTHMTAHWAFLAVDLWALTTDPVERAKYRTVLDNINLHLPNYSSSLRQQMRPNPTNSTAFFWHSRWGQYAAPGQDVSHGNNVLAYIVEANRLGVEWTSADMQKFVRTLRSHVWKSGGGYAAYVDGSGSGNGWVNDGFVKLGRYDVAVQKRLEAYTVGRGMQLYGNGALNAKLLNGR